MQFDKCLPTAPLVFINSTTRAKHQHIGRKQTEKIYSVYNN
ncbi:hypothetical protein HMPREF9148_02609 [Prevotella sp. F0091]|nr:hypothetical protein HMPREF9148_02609 [Prevotella sp. F0091]